MEFPRPQAIVLDVGNTLIEMDHAAIAAHAASMGLRVEADDVRQAEWRARRQLDEFLATPTRSTESHSTFARYLGLIWSELGLSGDGWLPLLERRAKLWTVLLPQSERALEELARRGYRLAVVSNSDGQVAQLLEELGIAHYFEVIVDSGAVGLEKPDPAIFALAVARLGVDAEQALYVGDLYHVDVRGAEAAGLTCALVDPLWHRWEYRGPRIRDLSELLKLVP